MTLENKEIGTRVRPEALGWRLKKMLSLLTVVFEEESFPGDCLLIVKTAIALSKRAFWVFMSKLTLSRCLTCTMSVVK